ncbi:transposase [Hoeflea sp. IMCC20628]|uniref:IS66 family transposase n=1 Tax=Hoeflea sp. IMCC20628 TaxID=1620421 RepID=UPI00063B081E|nr:transposase [Hoeflea sp. IMCC20628]
MAGWDIRCTAHYGDKGRGADYRCSCEPVGGSFKSGPTKGNEFDPRPLAWRISGASIVDAHRSQGSAIAEEAIRRIAALYGIEKEGRGQLPADRASIRQEKAKPLLDGYGDLAVSAGMGLGFKHNHQA